MTFEFIPVRCDGPAGWLEYNRNLPSTEPSLVHSR